MSTPSAIGDPKLLKDLEELFHRDIVLTRHMGVQVKAYANDELVVGAPLALNLNHKQTAFGGSLNCLVTLAGWGMVYLILEEMGLDAQIIIQESQISYLKPIAQDFDAICLKPAEAMVGKFKKMVQKKGVGRLPLNVVIYVDDELAVTFRGSYVATVLPSP